MFLVFWKCIKIHIPLGEIKMFMFLLVQWYDKNIPTWKFQCLVCLKYASCAKTFATHYIQSLNIRIFVLVNTNCSHVSKQFAYLSTCHTPVKYWIERETQHLKVTDFAWANHTFKVSAGKKFGMSEMWECLEINLYNLRQNL